MCAARPRAARSLATGILVLGAAGGLLSACSGPVEVNPPRVLPAGCERTNASWPASVGGQERRDTTSRSPFVAAWGDPAIIARCGVPALGPTTEQCLNVEGVDWVVRRLSDGAAFTTYGRDPAMEVLVPDAYAPEPLVLPAFAVAARLLPTNGRACS